MPKICSTSSLLILAVSDRKLPRLFNFSIGLHTFLLYLGPHIAAVTMAAYECGSTDFPSPPYPDSILCPETEVSAESKATNAAKAVVTIWSIMSKVRVEAFCWGAGTALGMYVCLQFS